MIIWVKHNWHTGFNWGSTGASHRAWRGRGGGGGRGKQGEKKRVLQLVCLMATCLSCSLWVKVATGPTATRVWSLNGINNVWGLKIRALQLRPRLRQREINKLKKIANFQWPSSSWWLFWRIGLVFCGSKLVKLDFRTGLDFWLERMWFRYIPWCWLERMWFRYKPWCWLERMRFRYIPWCWLERMRFRYKPWCWLERMRFRYIPGCC